MKTCEEMASAVMIRARKYRAQRKKRILRTISVAAVFFLLLTAGMYWDRRESGNDTARNPRLAVMCAAAEHERKEALVEGVATPLKYLIRVRDLRGVVTEAERKEIDVEESEINKGILLSQVGPQGEKGQTRWGSRNTIVSLVQNEFLYIQVVDYDQVQDMSVETTDAGCATVVPYPYERTDENGAVTKVDTGIHINWSLSDATINRIDENPDMNLSEICDTVKVIVKFKDGVTETVEIDLSVDAEGQIFVVHKGTVLTEP